MPLRVLGPRVLLRPVAQAPRSSIITLTDRDPPTVGDIVGIGTTRCSECDAIHAPEFAIGDRVLVPASAGQEITVDGETLWAVPIAHVLSYWSSHA